MERDLQDWVLLIVGTQRYIGRPINRDAVDIVPGELVQLRPCFELLVATYPITRTAPNTPPQIHGIQRELFVLSLLGFKGGSSADIQAAWKPDGVICFDTLEYSDRTAIGAMIDTLLRAEERDRKIAREQALLEGGIGR